VPAGRPGPLCMDVRWNAAVDRMTGAAERHSTACIEFRPGAGLWSVVSFADEAARGRWSPRVKAAFRWLADTGFGGERSRGWGRAEAPEFVEGALPEMILGAGGQGSGAGEASVVASGPDVLPGPPAGEPEEPSPVPPLEEPPAEPPSPDPEPGLPGPEPEPLPEPAGAESAAETLAGTPELPSTTETSLAPGPRPPAPNAGPLAPHWLLSLFSPAPTDTIDWSRGNYAAVTRGGRLDSPERSGELKKQVQMVAEGSVLFAAAPPRGAAPDVAPDGFPHPVFRAGFALAIPLPRPEGASL
jgi:hypothetical protein